MGRKWWGWGDENVSYSLEDRPAFWPFLEKSFGRSIGGRVRPVPLESIPLPEPRLSSAELERLAAAAGGVISQDRRERVLHAAGRGYRDLLNLRSGRLERVPDAVVFPTGEEQVSRLLAAAAEMDLAVVPFGGGSSVVGGVDPLAGGKRAVLTCDLTRMNRLLEVDRESLLAVAEAGVLGPDLERALGAHGLTLGHFPQSFEFSSLGGWAATRSAGQSSTRYGKIEDMVQSLRMATPSGILETHAVPASAASRIRELWLGSEGLLGS